VASSRFLIVVNLTCEPIPEPSGILQNYMPKLEDWAAEGPVDLRTKPPGGAEKT
jgi:hypothetical protein